MIAVTTRPDRPDGPSRSARFAAWFFSFALTAAVPVAVRAASAPDDLAQRRALCERSIALAGLEAQMDADIRGIVAGATADLSAKLGTESSATAAAYAAALEDALRTAKGPVLARLKESCAAAFTAPELKGINAFYASKIGQAWLEKTRTQMLPALASAIDAAMPQIVADIRKGFCARVGCEEPQAAPAGSGKRKL